MPIPTTIDDLSTTAGTNYPQDSDTPNGGDDVIRAHASFIASLRDKLNGTSSTGTLTTPVFAGNPTGTLTPGTWTPTLTNVGNAINLLARYASYMRVGNIVQYAIILEAQASATGGTQTQIGISLPVASNFSSGDHATGIGGVTGEDPGYVFADTANDRLTFIWNASVAGVQARRIVGQYTVI